MLGPVSQSRKRGSANAPSDGLGSCRLFHEDMRTNDRFDLRNANPIGALIGSSGCDRYRPFRRNRCLSSDPQASRWRRSRILRAGMKKGVHVIDAAGRRAQRLLRTEDVVSMLEGVGIRASTWKSCWRPPTSSAACSVVHLLAGLPVR